MEKLIMEALDAAIIKLDKITPEFKKEKQSISLIDVDPIDLTSFMEENGIPSNAYFDYNNSYEWSDVVLTWKANVPTNRNDKLKFRRVAFSMTAYKSVYRSLLANGYKGVPFIDGVIEDPEGVTVYDMYMNRDIHKLVEFYSRFFIKK